MPDYDRISLCKPPTLFEQPQLETKCCLPSWTAMKRGHSPARWPSNHPTTIVETTKIITPARTQSADRNGGLRKAAETRQSGVGAQVNPRPQSMGKSDRGQNQPSGNRTTMRRELGRR